MTSDEELQHKLRRRHDKFGFFGASIAISILIFSIVSCSHPLHWLDDTLCYDFLGGLIAATGLLFTISFWWEPYSAKNRKFYQEKGNRYKFEKYHISFFIGPTIYIAAMGVLIAGEIKANKLRPFLPIVDSIFDFTSWRDFDDRIAENPDPYLHGKILVANFDTNSIAFDIQRMLPTKMTTFDPNNINFVVGLHKTKKIVGNYVPEYLLKERVFNPDYSTDKDPDAIMHGFIVDLIDFDNRAKIATTTIWGPPPPNKISGSGGYEGKLPKPAEVYNYLMTLPYSP